MTARLGTGRAPAGLAIPPVRVRALRGVRTGQETCHPWLVAELRLLAP